MHCVGWLPGFDDAGAGELIECAAERGLGLYPIAPHHHVPPARPGLLLGFASLSPSQLKAATRVLGDCLARVAGGRARGAASPERPQR